MMERILFYSESLIMAISCIKDTNDFYIIKSSWHFSVLSYLTFQQHLTYVITSSSLKHQGTILSWFSSSNSLIPLVILSCLKTLNIHLCMCWQLSNLFLQDGTVSWTPGLNLQLPINISIWALMGFSSLIWPSQSALL